VRLQSISKGLVIKAGRLERTAFEEKRRKTAILQRLEFLTSVLENLPYPFYVIDASDYVICLTNAARAYRGESTARITCHALLHQRDKPCASEGFPCPVEKIKQTKSPSELNTSTMTRRVETIEWSRFMLSQSLTGECLLRRGVLLGHHGAQAR